MGYIIRKTFGRNVITEFTTVNQAVDYHNQLRWGPIISGLVIAIATQLVLSARSAAIGAGNTAGF